MITNCYKITIDMDDQLLAYLSDPTDPDSDYVHTVVAFLEEFFIPSYSLAIECQKALFYRLPKLNFIIIEV